MLSYKPTTAFNFPLQILMTSMSALLFAYTDTFPDPVSPVCEIHITNHESKESTLNTLCE